MRYEGRALIVSVGDLVRIGAEFWEVRGVHLGALAAQDYYSIAPVTRRDQGNLTGCVPREFLEELLRIGGATGYTVAEAE